MIFKNRLLPDKTDECRFNYSLYMERYFSNDDIEHDTSLYIDSWESNQTNSFESGKINDLSVVLVDKSDNLLINNKLICSNNSFSLKNILKSDKQVLGSDISQFLGTKICESKDKTQTLIESVNNIHRLAVENFQRKVNDIIKGKCVS